MAKKAKKESKPVEPVANEQRPITDFSDMELKAMIYENIVVVEQGKKLLQMLEGELMARRDKALKPPTKKKK